MPVIRSGNADIAYEVTGDGDPLLLVMGFTADSRMWMMQTPELSQHYRCIVFDNRGSGGSTLPAGVPLTMEDMAADGLAVLDELGVERAHVVGISMGGAIAQHLALKAPERVRSLTLAATWCAPNPYTQRVARLGKAITDTLGLDALVEAFMLWVFTPKFLITAPEMADGIQKLMRDSIAPRETFNAQLEALLAHDTRDRLASLDIPTLVTVGRRDILVPPELSEQIASTIPGAELVKMDAGHAFNVEEYQRFNQTLLDFLRAR